ncbi:unnamed protein product [Rhizophagus irregularis]|nr:unnamed protein product [Rhizophagus irregularis]CAB5365409.1 unnamed protein product [Rhizophagus irregularis]
MVNWQAFRRRVLRERKIKRDLCKLREDLADQALKFGFIREKFIDWISSISAELLSTQTLEYWLLSYVSETASSDANFWCEFISPRDWLLCCFDINIETAIAIVSGVSEDYLEQQTPRLLLQTELGQQADESTLFYHTTNLWGAENIITEGIDFGECSRRQDFGGRTVSYYLNNNFKNAVEFARQRVLNSPAIIVYHIPATLLGQYDHLNLSGMFFSGGPYRIKGVK